MKNQLTKNRGFSATGLRFLFIVLLVTGVFFRFVNLERKVYWHDEVYTSLRSSGYTQAEMIQQVFDGRVIGIKDLQKYQRLSPDKSLIDTIHALVENPEHPPLYYLMARFWMQLFGDYVRTPRGLSASISLLVLPCVYWLCLELFKSPLVGWVAVALFTISPFHVLYAQEAREYSLWTVTILLSSAVLVRATRMKKLWTGEQQDEYSTGNALPHHGPPCRNLSEEEACIETPKSQSLVKTQLYWGVYAITLALSFYTFLFSGFVAIGHGIYVFATERFRFSKTVAAYLLASGVGILAFAPWLFIIITNLPQFKSKTYWTHISELPSFMVKKWGFHLSCIFLDFGFPLEHPFTYLAPPILLILVTYSMYVLCCNTPKTVWLFVLTLIGVTAIALILPDLIWGGRRSVSSRYFIPCYLGIQLSVAYLFATKITSTRSFEQKFWQGIMALLISGGVISCVIISQSDTWWNKIIGYHNHKIAQIINQSPHPLLISNTSDINTGDVISLSYLLEPKVRLQLVVDPNVPKIPDGFSDVFLFYPSKALQQGLEKEYNAKKEPFYEVDGLIPLWK